MPTAASLIDEAAAEGLGLAAPVLVPLLCRTSPDGPGGAPHDVVLHPDGYLETPHDLEAERIGAAFGSYLSCLEVVDRVVPAVREWVTCQRRTRAPVLRRDRNRRWHLRDRFECCRPGWMRAAEAAEHGRSVSHLAALHGTSPRLLRPFVAVLCAEFGWPGRGAPLDPHRRAAAESCVLERGGVEQLWVAGIPPETVVRISLALAGRRSRLPIEFYLGATTRRPDLAWVSASATPAEPGEPDPETLAWLAWTETSYDRRHPDDRGDWLRLGVPRSLLLELSGSGYAPADVQRLATTVGRTPAHAATLLLSWLQLGLNPEVERLGVLHEAGVPDLRLSGGAFRRLEADLAAGGIDLSDLETAELLLVWGNATEAAACARAGGTDPLSVARALYTAA